MRLFFWVLAVALWLSSSQSFAQIDPTERRSHAQERLRLHKNGIENQWQVMVRADDSAELYQILNRLVGDYPDMEITRIWEHALKGFLATMPLEDARKLAQDPHIRLVEQDSIIPKTPVVQKALIKGDSGTKDPNGDAPCFCGIGQFYQNDLPHTGGTQTISWPKGCPGGPDCLDNWGLDRIDQRDGLDNTYTPRPENNEVRIYLVDSGINTSHVEFTDGKGNSRILTGYNATGDGKGTADVSTFGHGTHVAAIAGGLTFGVSKKAKLVPIRVDDGDGFNIPNLLSAVDWIAQTHPSDKLGVVNFSLNSNPGTNAFLNSAPLAWAMRSLEEMGLVIVNSAGNHGSNVTNPPNAAQVSMVGRAYPQSIIVVGASASDDSLFYDPFCEYGSCGTNTGEVITLYAPGEAIVSAGKTGDKNICILSGTSMAAPHVSGAAALLLSEYPHLGPSTVKKVLSRAATAGAITNLGKGSNKLLNIDFESAGPTPVAGDNWYRIPAGQRTFEILRDKLISDDLFWNGDSQALISFSEEVNGKIQSSPFGGLVFKLNDDYRPTPYTNPTYASFNYTVQVGKYEDTATVYLYPEPTSEDKRFRADRNSTISLTDQAWVSEGTITDITLIEPFSGKLTYEDDFEDVDYSSPGNTTIDRFLYTVSWPDGSPDTTSEVTIYVDHPAYPPPPSGLVYPRTNNTGFIQVDWQPSPSNNVTHYRLVETNHYSLVRVVENIDQTFFYAASLVDGGEYRYSVSACTPLGCSDPIVFEDKFSVNPVPSVIDHFKIDDASPAPVTGHYYNPSRDGVGIDIQKFCNRWQVAWTTYRDSNGTPVWYMSDPVFLVGNGDEGPPMMETALNEYRLVNGVAQKNQVGKIQLNFDGDGTVSFIWNTFTGTPGVTSGSETIHFLVGGGGVTGWWQDMDDPEKEWYYGFADHSRITAGVLFYRPDGSPTWVFNGDTSPWYQPVATGELLYRRAAHQSPSQPPGLQVLTIPNYVGNFRMEFPSQSPSAGEGTINLNIGVPAGVDPKYPNGYNWSASGPVQRVELANGQDCNQ